MSYSYRNEGRAFVAGLTIGLFLCMIQLAANAQGRQCPVGQIFCFGKCVDTFNDTATSASFDPKPTRAGRWRDRGGRRSMFMAIEVLDDRNSGLAHEGETDSAIVAARALVSAPSLKRLITVSSKHIPLGRSAMACTGPGKTVYV